MVTGYTGYRLFVNGQQVEEDIGPWAKWTDPETVNIAPYLRAGHNVIAATRTHRTGILTEDIYAAAGRSALKRRGLETA